MAGERTFRGKTPGSDREWQTQGQVDPEDAAPACQLGDAAAPERPDQATSLSGGGHGADAEGALVGGHGRHGNRHRNRYHGAAADGLNAAASAENREAASESDPGGSKHENRESDREDATVTETVGDATHERHRDDRLKPTT